MLVMSETFNMKLLGIQIKQNIACVCDRVTAENCLLFDINTDLRMLLIMIMHLCFDKIYISIVLVKMQKSLLLFCF